MAKNERTPLKTLRQLAQDPDQSVQQTAKKRLDKGGY